MFSSRDRVLALDMGSSSLKAVELEHTAGGPKLKRIASVDLTAPADGDRESRPDHKAKVISALGDLLRGMGIQPKKVRKLITCLPGSQVSIKQIRCPALPEGEIRSALVFEARKHLPVEGEVLMDYQILARRPEDLDILLVVTTKQAVVHHLAMLEACGLKGGVIEAPSLSLWNAALAKPEAKPTAEPFGILSIGAATSNLSFFQDGGLFLTREIPIAGDRFTADEREKNGQDFPEAEKAKISRGLLGTATASVTAGGAFAGPALELEVDNQGQNPSLQNLVREVQRSIRFYLKESGKARIASLALAGGSAASPGLDEWLARELGVPVSPLDPLDTVADGIPLPANRRQFAQAVGMALRGAHEFFPR